MSYSQILPSFREAVNLSLASFCVFRYGHQLEAKQHQWEILITRFLGTYSAEAVGTQKLGLAKSHTWETPSTVSGCRPWWATGNLHCSTVYTVEYTALWCAPPVVGLCLAIMILTTCTTPATALWSQQQRASCRFVAALNYKRQNPL